MFGEMSLWGWLGTFIVFAVGGGAGFFIARQIKDKRTLQLEQQLDAAKQQLTDYRQDVNRHFLKTSLLVSKLTDNYREVYEHLATGAQKLCTEQLRTPELKLPDSKILPTDLHTGITADNTATTETETVTEQMPLQSASEDSIVEQNQPATTEHDAQAAIAEETAASTKAASEDSEDEVPLGAESTPGIEPQHHKTHPAIH